MSPNMRSLSIAERELTEECAANRKTIDALVAALKAVRKGVPDVLRRECLNDIVDDALERARA